MAFFFHSMLVQFVADTKMKVPDYPDKHWSPKDFPHFHVFSALHLGMPIGEKFYDLFTHNAALIADIPEEEIRKVTLEDLNNRGLRGFSI